TGGFGMAQVALEAPDGPAFYEYVAQGAETLAKTRPTAQNLFYAIEKVKAAIDKAPDVAAARRAAVAMAQAIADEDAASCESIGRIGGTLIRDGARVMTHCNAGWLAFVDWGTALAPIYNAHRAGRKVFVFADETRPRGQGASLTAWELGNEGVPFKIIPDNASGYLMRKGEIDLVIVGSDRIAANGDVANKIGTYEKAVLAHELGIPFYVAAPSSTIDPNCPDGDAIPIEERSQDEVLYAYGLQDDGKLGRVRVAPAGASARNPAFDVTPARYIKNIITEKGIFAPERILDSVKTRE
ncbi:S-methyl-5-thioribose-1-phosphate isomerase, partial [bacterium]